MSHCGARNDENGIMLDGSHPALTGHRANGTAYRCIGVARTGADAFQCRNGSPMGMGSLCAAGSSATLDFQRNKHFLLFFIAELSLLQ